MDQIFQPMLKIRRLGPLVVLDTQERGKSFWMTDQSVEVYVFKMSICAPLLIRLLQTFKYATRGHSCID